MRSGMWSHRLALICIVSLHLCINVENSSLLTYQHVGHTKCSHEHGQDMQEPWWAHVGDAARLRGGYLDSDSEFKINVPARPIELYDDDDPYYFNVTQVSVMEEVRKSLDPDVYPPEPVQYGEDGDMIYPEPMSLETFGRIKLFNDRRVLDEETGRLLTSRETEKRGLSIFKRKPKGKNSLAKRCACGNKTPCLGNVVITRDENNKIHDYSKYRQRVGDHIFNKVKPLPSQQTISDDRKAVGRTEGVARREAMDAESQRALFVLQEEDSSETVKEMLLVRHEMEEDLKRADVIGMDEKTREKKRIQLKELTQRIDQNILYAPFTIKVGNKNYTFNQPGAATGLGEFDEHDYDLAVDKLPAPPEGDFIRVPGKNGQTILLDPGLHFWYGKTFVHATSSKIPMLWEDEHRTVNVGPLSMQDGMEEQNGVIYEIQSFTDENDNQTTRAHNITLRRDVFAHGMWFLCEETSGLFHHLTCYTRAGSYPGMHCDLKPSVQNQEPVEVGERFRPRTLTEDCFLIMGSGWKFVSCDIFCLDGVAVYAVDVSNSSFIDCAIGGPVYLDQPDNEWDRLELAYMGVRMEGAAIATLVRCVIQKTQIYGLKVDECNEVVVLDSVFNSNGCMGGAAVAMSRCAECSFSSCYFNESVSHSPLWRHTAAFETKITAQGGARLQLRNSTVVGRKWLTYYRPKFLEEENNVYLPGKRFFNNTCRPGWEQAREANIEDPVMVSGDSYHEIWWPRKMLHKAGFQDGDYPEDGYGNVRGHTELDIFEDDLEEVEIMLNRSKEIILQDWGWEGTMEDALDTSSPRALNEGKWLWREELEPQNYKKEMSNLRKRKKMMAERRGPVVSRFSQLMNSSSSSQTIRIIRSIVRESHQGDLASEYWLKKKLQEEQDEEVRAELQQALSNISVGEDDLRELIGQYRGCQIDEKGVPTTNIKVGRYHIMPDLIPSYVRAAVWPFFPIYPQLQGALKEKSAASTYTDPAASLLAVQAENVSQPGDDRMADEEEEEKEMGIEKREEEDGTLQLVDQERWMKAPWFEGVKFENGKIAPLELDLSNETQLMQLPCEDRIQLAQLGYVPFPTLDDMAEEERNRTVDESFRMFSAPEWNQIIIPALWDYAHKMRVPIPNGTEIKAERRRLTKELELTKKYFEALELSVALHLEEEEWKSLYPQLDPNKLFDPPSDRKLESVYDRICELRAYLTMAVNDEKYALMMALYPLAKEVEVAFKTRDRAKIDELAARHKNYDLDAKIADGLMEFPYSLSPDGNFVIVQKRLKKQFDLLRRMEPGESRGAGRRKGREGEVGDEEGRAGEEGGMDDEA
ncbi:hypothetical protein GUITHDRAFT_145926 [Guillardia theta CCMP2712]|uniref:Uncharacterized protein n=4 Tax=Guillardia theta TaxID=55529 RepID=L1IJF8_GUITC|nr:hypothetical protein GUITHDRAFT_145926 [Guillardia theta CCMP2712]EKX36242.1 hypothetical protein GUITHDRAFT_145926 [Guillardia theta CCMP2712]|eukprot:XP_005823222.1 hypothetical protein GUITHDRAFT_145926 [Guillardia theta CCMP2712]